MTWSTLDGQPTRIIAHRGASGDRPEHTMEAYNLGVAQGADVIEPDLVCTADHKLVARHDAWLSRSTDVGERIEFAKRRRPGWGNLDDWWAADFSAAELAQLHARQP